MTSPFGKHATIPPGMAAPVRWLQAQPGVKRIIFGPYRRRKKSAGEVALAGRIPGGLIVLLQGQDVSMRVSVLAEDPEALAERLGGRFPSPLGARLGGGDGGSTGQPSRVG